MFKNSMSLNGIVKKIKERVVEPGENLFIECLSKEEIEELKQWSNNKTESYLINQLKKFTECETIDYIKRYGKESNYNIVIDLIDYKL